MDKSVLKNVCEFLQSQKDCEAHFATFWDKTKEFYPPGQSKTKLRAWLKEQSDRFEIIANKNGDPFGKVKLKAQASSDALPATSKSEDNQIIQKLVKSIDNKQENGHLFAIICKNKAEIFPKQLQDKKYIRQWLIKNDKHFKIVRDGNGGISAVEVMDKARKMKKGQISTTTSQGKAKPQEEQDTGTLMKMADDIALRISQTIQRISKSEPLPLEVLLSARDVIYPISDKESLKTFLTSYSSKFELIDLEGIGEWVQLKSTGDQGFVGRHRGGNHSVGNHPVGNVNSTKTAGAVYSGISVTSDGVTKVTSYIFKNGGTVPFANLVKDAGQLLDGLVDGPKQMSAWLSANITIFETITNPDDPSKPLQVKVRFGFSPRFCQNYVANGQCDKKNCQFLHICKAYVSYKCEDERCGQSHNIRDAHNKVIIDKMGSLGNETDDVVVQVLRKSCFPRVCKEYNKTGVCPRKEKCHFLHICGNYVINQCSGPCSLCHNVAEGLHNIELLKKYSLLPSKKLTQEMVKMNIAFAPTSQQKTNVTPLPLSQPQPDQSTEMKGKKKKRYRTRRRGRKPGNASSSTVDNTSSAESGCDSDVDSGSIVSSKRGGNQPLLSSSNIEKSNLASSLTGLQKVQSWMGGPAQHVVPAAPGPCPALGDVNTTPDFYSAPGVFPNPGVYPNPGVFPNPGVYPNPSLYPTQALYHTPGLNQSSPQLDSSSESSEISEQSSVVSTQSSVWQDDLQKKVFITILEKYNGNASFNKISKEKDLFNSAVDAVKWFERHPRDFLLHRNGQGKIDDVSVFSRKARICLDYSGKHGCSKPKCPFFHICRNHIEGNCFKGKSCHRNHDISHETIREAAKRIGLQDLTSSQLYALVCVSIPSVCHYHNQGHCNRGLFCPKIHVCKLFVKKGSCPDKERCKLGHEQALKEDPAQRILKMYQLFTRNPNYKYIRKMIFVFNMRRQSKGQNKNEVGEDNRQQLTREVRDEVLPCLIDVQLSEAVIPRQEDEKITQSSEKLTEKVTQSSEKLTEKITKSEEVTPSICHLFLIGQRHKLKKCSDVHFDLPYLWQLKLTGGASSDSWLQFDKNDCENIEKYFCDVNCPATILNISTKITEVSSSSVYLDFQEMSGHLQVEGPQPSLGNSFKIRRLECKPGDVHENEAWYQTRWMWYKKDIDTSRWIQYEQSKVSAYEATYLDGNLQTDWSKLRRRPAELITQNKVAEEQRSSREKQTLTSPVQLNSPSLSSLSIPSSPSVSSVAHQVGSDAVRENTTSSKEFANDCHMTRVEPGSSEYDEVEKRFLESFGQTDVVVKQIEKIVNNDLWNKYKSKKKLMTDKLEPGVGTLNFQERHIFVPCRSEDIERIMKGNIHDSRTVLPELWGPGYYFTSNALFCVRWCTESASQSRFLIVCQVLLGTYTQGSEDLREFPRRPDGTHYDSLVNTTTEPCVFMVKNVDQCYPTYVIEFKMVGDSHGSSPPAYPSSTSHDHEHQRVSAAIHPLATPYISPSTNTSHDVPTVTSIIPTSPAEEYVKVAPTNSERPPPPQNIIPNLPPPPYTRYANPNPSTDGGDLQNSRSAGQISGLRRPGNVKEKDCMIM